MCNVSPSSPSSISGEHQNLEIEDRPKQFQSSPDSLINPKSDIDFSKNGFANMQMDQFETKSNSRPIAGGPTTYLQGQPAAFDFHSFCPIGRPFGEFMPMAQQTPAGSQQFLFNQLNTASGQGNPNWPTPGLWFPWSTQSTTSTK